MYILSVAVCGVCSVEKVQRAGLRSRYAATNGKSGQCANDEIPLWPGRDSRALLNLVEGTSQKLRRRTELAHDVVEPRGGSILSVLRCCWRVGCVVSKEFDRSGTDGEPCYLTGDGGPLGQIQNPPPGTIIGVRCFVRHTHGSQGPRA